MIRLQAPLDRAYADAGEAELVDRLAAARAELGGRALILGHHYQREDVIRWADARGDSFRLARVAADSPDAQYIVFCGVHFMAESADILTAPDQHVFLPDLNAGCSMADMADIDAVEEAWESLEAAVGVDAVIPITYMNSSAALKAFVGDHGGAVCTSSNAQSVLRWALAQGARQILFFPDQHLGRNSALAMGYSPSDMVVWDPHQAFGGVDKDDLAAASFVLWKGHCSVHQRFKPAHVEAFRREHPDGVVIVHPECSHEVVGLADRAGSTDRIIEYVEGAPDGAVIGVGTEIHLVQRLAAQHPAKRVVSLDPIVCPCSTMFRIDPAHLCWILESLAQGHEVNRISVPEDVARSARVALDRMLAIP